MLQRRSAARPTANLLRVLPWANGIPLKRPSYAFPHSYEEDAILLFEADLIPFPRVAPPLLLFY